ncbi:MAG TPA: glycosyltransferase [Haliangiales bacterium]|nr:glycosyltransferase [Haliangiales bacterium]
MSGDDTPVTILMPIYDDWESAFVLVGRIVRALAATSFKPTFLLVDDGSSIAPPHALPQVAGGATVDVLHLRRNLGHQRAIAIGLAYVQQNQPSPATIVMDGDGEDTAEGVVALLRRFVELGGRQAVFAVRGRRTEGLMFRAFYVLYRNLYRFLTGRSVREGNFSVLSFGHLDQLVAVSELWNHYAAAVFKARLPIDRIAIDRGMRIAGRSRMSLLSLIAHGLSAISVFADVVGLRLLIATCILAVLTVGVVIAVVVIRFATSLAIPGWATNATGLLLLLLTQAALLSLVFVFMVLQSRNTSSFIPLRDYVYFVSRRERIAPGVDG